MPAFCTYCSKDKSTEDGEIPAVRRYQSSRIAKVYAAASHLGIKFFILSGKFGLITPDKPIPWYDHPLKAEEVNNLAKLMTRQIYEYGITSIVYFTRSLTQDPQVLPYREALVDACSQTSRPFLVVELETL